MIDCTPSLDRLTNFHRWAGTLLAVVCFVTFGAYLTTLTLACSASAEAALDKGVEVNCHALQCPTPEELTIVLELYAEGADDLGYAFNPYATLVVDWHAEGEVLDTYETADGETFRVLARTLSGDRVEASSMQLFAHECGHVMLIRETGDGDRTHEAPPGAWTPEITELGREVYRAWSGMNPSPSTNCEVPE
jgi:hypothetical protein